MHLLMTAFYYFYLYTHYDQHFDRGEGISMQIVEELKTVSRGRLVKAKSDEQKKAYTSRTVRMTMEKARKMCFATGERQ